VLIIIGVLLLGVIVVLGITVLMRSI